MNTTWAIQSPYRITEGSEPTFEMTIRGTSVDVTSITSSKLYRNGSDVSATCLNGLASIVNSSKIRLPKIMNLKGGNVYVFAIKLTVNGQPFVFKLELIVDKPGQEQ